MQGTDCNSLVLSYDGIAVTVQKENSAKTMEEVL